MAATKYNIYIRYMNNNRVITGQSDYDWISNHEYNELTAFYKEYSGAYNALLEALNDGSKQKENFTTEELTIYNKCTRITEFEANYKKGAAVKEYVGVEPFDEMYLDPNIIDTAYDPRRSRLLREMKNEKFKRDAEYQQIITKESKSSNPKYDMIFMYDGLGKQEAAKNVYNENPRNTNSQITPYIYYDNMKRVELINAWFFYAQFASLKAAMIKAAELANIMGTDGVLIGKDVPLDQYIDII